MNVAPNCQPCLNVSHVCWLFFTDSYHTLPPPIFFSSPPPRKCYHLTPKYLLLPNSQRIFYCPTAQEKILPPDHKIFWSSNSSSPELFLPLSHQKKFKNCHPSPPKKFYPHPLTTFCHLVPAPPPKNYYSTTKNSFPPHPSKKMPPPLPKNFLPSYSKNVPPPHHK